MDKDELYVSFRNIKTRININFKCQLIEKERERETWRIGPLHSLARVANHFFIPFLKMDASQVSPVRSRVPCVEVCSYPGISRGSR